MWNGEDGRTIFFQNEMPYDVPDQAAWSSGRGEGWAAYKVGDGVKRHEAWGLGSYCFFSIGGREHARRRGARLRGARRAGRAAARLVTVSLGGNGAIRHVVNDAGGGTQDTGATAINLVALPAAAVNPLFDISPYPNLGIGSCIWLNILRARYMLQRSRVEIGNICCNAAALKYQQIFDK